MILKVSTATGTV